ncbi:hypothetical protein Ciccas_006758 [Cichlidogyrus casuarinus]|uniref:Uncharacterized protein n=1 Tax=Cichlidogyrus casuarinus TaxID=1844966 RepID=A0ABD2Q4V3_9PLAT
MYSTIRVHSRKSPRPSTASSVQADGDAFQESGPIRRTRFKEEVIILDEKDSRLNNQELMFIFVKLLNSINRIEEKLDDITTHQIDPNDYDYQQKPQPIPLIPLVDGNTRCMYCHQMCNCTPFGI